MSRLVTICTIILLIVALSITGIFYARDVKTDFDVMIQEALDACEKEDQQALLAKAGEMFDHWENREGFLSFYVRHDEIEKMSTHLVSLQGYAEQEAYDSAHLSLRQMEFMVDHIYNRELPNMDNLF